MPKPTLLEEKGYPARLEEIRRKGWRAHRVVRVHQPPPLDKAFLRAVELGDMACDFGRIPRGELGGGFKHRFEDDRQGGRLNIEGGEDFAAKKKHVEKLI